MRRIIINSIFVLIISIVTIFSLIIYLYNDQRNYVDDIYFYILMVIAIISIIYALKNSIAHFKQSTNSLYIMSIIAIIVTIFLSFIITLTGNMTIYALIFNIWVISFIILLITSILSFAKKNVYVLNYIFIFSVLAVFAGIKYLEINVNFFKKQLLNVAKNIEYLYENSDKIYNADELNHLLNEYNNINVINVSNDYFIISSRTNNTGGIHWMVYDSRDKDIKKIGRRDKYDYELIE